jgi:hypothetical protein
MALRENSPFAAAAPGTACGQFAASAWHCDCVERRRTDFAKGAENEYSNEFRVLTGLTFNWGAR